MQEPYSLELEIIPGILEKEWSEIEKKLQTAMSFASIVHVDLLDGKFAPNTTWMDPSPFKNFTQQKIFEVHLMVDDPIRYIDSFAEAGFTRFIGHIEKMPDITAFVAKGQEVGEVGLAVDTPTGAEKLFPYTEDIDVAFVMTVKAGYSRQSFLPEMLEKVRALRMQVQYLPIEIDGGVNLETIQLAKESGATRFVTTGYVFDSPDSAHQYETLKTVLD